MAGIKARLIRLEDYLWIIEGVNEMDVEVVWVAYDGHYATTELANVTDVQVLDGVTIFFESNIMLMAVSTIKLVYFKKCNKMVDQEKENQ